ncbi:unnamed protein product, partial [Mesorhabditis belari]|uniref:DH domain-containing protein n=1 Tax=Mesorhabditis belari TaxID=2138241 RepID=A0AAF3F531_9BILA
MIELQRKCFRKNCDGFGFLNRRALSDSELCISSDEVSERTSILDKYGLIDAAEEDFPLPAKTCICIPDGVVIGEFECTVSPEFFESLAKSFEHEHEHGPIVETSDGKEVKELEKQASQPILRERPLLGDLPLRVSDPTGRSRSKSPEHKEESQSRDSSAPPLPRRVVSLAIGGLKKSLGIGKVKKEVSQEEDGSENGHDDHHNHISTLRQHLKRSERDSQSSANTSISSYFSLPRPSLNRQNGLPDDLASCMSPTSSGPLTDFEEGMPERPSRLQLELPLWSRFGLFDADEYNSWSKKFRTDSMVAKEVLRQDKIYELISTEKQHCANLAFLKQAYRTRFLEDAHDLSLGQYEIDILIPDVLDALLVFHINLLHRLTERQKEKDQVETIADIIVEELSESGEHTARAVNAYTTFGVNKEESEKKLEELKERALFRKYLDNLVQSDPWYRKFEKFKSLMTRAMARTTRYHLILQDIQKNDLNDARKDLNYAAVMAAKGFASRIDQALCVSQMTKTWEIIRERIDWTARTKIATNDATMPLVDFYMTDLSSDKSEGEGRKILGIGQVTVKPIGSDKFNGDTSCTLILFDDILVFLQKRQQRYVFFPQEQAVFAVATLYPRAIERGWSTHLMSSSFKPMLMELQFRNKSDRAKWMDVFEKGISRAPKQVRLPPRRPDAQTAKEREKEERRQRDAEEHWVRRLESHFEERRDSEGVVAEYLDRRMQWFDRLRSIVSEMPFKSRQEIPEKVKATVRQRFRELRQLRVEPISKLVAKCTQARDQDLIDFFDDTAEIQNLDSDSGSDTSGSEGKNLPRRVQTFHGMSTPKREKGSFRRHTTVPKMSSMIHGASTSSTSKLETATLRMEEEDEEIEEKNDEEEVTSDEEQNKEGIPESPKTRERNREIVQKTQRLPLTMNLRARRAATQIIKENAELRQINDRLKHDLAMSRTALSLYEKSRVAPLGANGTGSSVSSSETHEALRRKEQELREGETRLNQDRDDFLDKKTQLEDKLKKQETELEERWRVLMEKETLIGGNLANLREDRRTAPPAMARPIPIPVLGNRTESIPIVSESLS